MFSGYTVKHIPLPKKLKGPVSKNVYFFAKSFLANSLRRAEIKSSTPAARDASLIETRM